MNFWKINKIIKIQSSSTLGPLTRARRWVDHGISRQPVGHLMCGLLLWLPGEERKTMVASILGCDHRSEVRDDDDGGGGAASGGDGVEVPGRQN